ncbi:MAG: NmrA family NAD(P)-binding protein [Chloroflexaceae bacterium]|nr:NmrA family NAD(P)-binding protein [Chloroflexaceae bacterium]
MTTTMRVLVYGGTGSQSNGIVWNLLERGHQPFVLTRTPEKAEAMRQAGATIVPGDMGDAETLRAASQGMDGVALQIPFFLRNPADAMAYGRNAVAAAKEAGVKIIAWNTSGPTPPARSGNPAVDVRIDLAEELQRSGVPHIIIEPTGYMENFLGPWTAPAVVAEDVLPYPNPAETRVGWIASADVAKFIVAALERPQLANRTFQVSGQENLNGSDLAERFSTALGRPISYYAMEPEEFGAVLDKVFGPGAGEAAAQEYRKARTNPNPPTMYFDMEPVLAQLPIQMTSLTEWVRQHRAAFSR